jgi:hypothetical protein
MPCLSGVNLHSALEPGIGIGDKLSPGKYLGFSQQSVCYA